MEGKNSILQNSLICLLFPATWISIGLLLVNDHIMKHLFPSWLTGKISDFSGLFFFPFVILAIIGFSIPSNKVSNEEIGIFVYGAIASWFVLLKSVEPVNQFTVQLVSALVGHPVYYVLDPSDIIAISAMIPSWMVWAKPKTDVTNPFARVILLVGVFASIATSGQEYTVHDVTSLEYIGNGVVFAADSKNWGDLAYPVARSVDGGISWEFDFDVSRIEEKSLPLSHCSFLYPDIWYRVTKKGRFEELADGENWSRVQGFEGIIVADMIIFEWEGEEYIIVAVGEFGIQRRLFPDGEWEKIPIIKANKAYPSQNP